MMPPTKDQSDIGLDNQTLDASDSEDNKDMARQEFAQEADINYMLSRFGVTPVRGAPTYGEWDDSIDLQIALESVREARDGYRTLPPELKQKFNSMEELLKAVDNGSLVLTEKPTQPPAVPLA